MSYRNVNQTNHVNHCHFVDSYLLNGDNFTPVKKNKLIKKMT